MLKPQTRLVPHKCTKNNQAILF